MNVLIVMHQGQAVGVVEQPDGVEAAELLRLWILRQGLNPLFPSGFTVTGSPVVPWESLRKTDQPIR